MHRKLFLGAGSCGERLLPQEACAPDPALSPAASSKSTDPRGGAFLCCHSCHWKESQGSGLPPDQRGLSAQAQLHRRCRFRSEPAPSVSVPVLTQGLHRGVFAEGRKKGAAILCPASRSPGPTSVSSRSHPCPVMSPFQAGLGVGGREGRSRTQRTRLRATTFPLAWPSRP